MRDYEIRLALDNALRVEHGDDADTLIRHELGLCAGRRRIDVALINGELTGYEIKSDEDTLVRLAGQAEAYGRVLDRAILVTTHRWLDKATGLLPVTWGVVTARCCDGDVHLEVVRESAANGSVDPFALAQLLWRAEALDELRVRGLARGLSGKARHYVWEALASAVPVDELRGVVRHRLKVRQDWPGGQSRGLYGGSLRSEATQAPDPLRPVT